jgi:hypothetical protein
MHLHHAVSIYCTLVILTTNKLVCFSHEYYACFYRSCREYLE